MNKKELVKHCLISDDSAETYPFKDKTYEQYAVIRHKNSGKWYALIFHLEKRLCINLKCNPVHSAILRDSYPFIKPAWHMNKTHWIMVDVNKAPISLLKELIAESYELTC